MQAVATTLTANGQLKAVFLTAKENRALQKELKIEHARMDYVCFVNELLFRMNNQDSTRAAAMCNDLLFMLNKIVLDNVFRYVAEKKAHEFMVLLAHRTFSKDIYINPFYVNQIIESTGMVIEDKTELENFITYKLQTYIDQIYTTHAESINVPLLGVFEAMFCNLQHINIGYYKFELMDYIQPILLYTERLYENHLYS